MILDKKTTSSERAGRYIRQPEGYRAFIPKPLPPDDPSLRMTEEVQQLLSEAERTLGRLDGSVQTLPDPDLFVYMYVRKEAVLSSQIEGTQSSLQDVLEAEANILRPEQPSDVFEVINYVRALHHGLDRLKDLPVCIRLLREIHERLLQGVRGARSRPGELRNSQNWIGSHGCTLNEAVFVPPPPAEAASSLGDLEKFLNDSGKRLPLVWIGLTHAQFETIHPFLDGNGRLGRLLITFLLVEQEILHQPVLYLSHHFRRYQTDYYERLQAVRDKGDWEGWIEFFLRGVRDVSQNAVETVGRINALRERHRAEIVDTFGKAAGNGLRILEALYSQPLITVVEVRKFLDVSYAAANQLIARLEKLGLLEQVTDRRRNRVFRYSPYLQLFEEDLPSENRS